MFRCLLCALCLCLLRELLAEERQFHTELLRSRERHVSVFRGEMPYPDALLSPSFVASLNAFVRSGTEGATVLGGPRISLREPSCKLCTEKVEP